MTISLIDFWQHSTDGKICLLSPGMSQAKAECPMVSVTGMMFGMDGYSGKPSQE